MKHSHLIAAIFLLAGICAQAGNIPDRISFSENRRFLVDEKGNPFFYLADTAWELFHRLDREEADLYLRDRAGKGFTVIQAVAIAEMDGISTPNAYGHLPFMDGDPARPAISEGKDDDYWDHVDYIVRRAGELGLYIAMLPTWGRYWHDGDSPVFNPENARIYGKWLATRYRDEHIIWILGGDRNPENESQRATIRSMAEGLREGDGHSHLISFHPGGARGSAEFFHCEDWLDLNMRQNGHDNRYELYGKTLEDYLREAARPVLDAEPIYEDHPIAFDASRRGHSTAADCRRALYWDLFNGACGHSYGHHSVWQMWDPGKNRRPVNNPLMPWREALEQSGAAQMQYGKRLMLSRPCLTRIPATDKALPAPYDIQTAWPGQGICRFAATMDTDGTFLMVYAPVGRRFLVNTTLIKGKKLRGWWYNPRNGKSRKIRKIERGEAVSFISPDPGEELDWILVIDDASKGYRRP